MIEFDSIHASPPVDCSNPDTINRVVIKAGPGVNDPVVGSYCLNELPESLWIPSLMGRVEFYTVDYDIYGFLATFHTCKLNSFVNTYYLKGNKIHLTWHFQLGMKNIYMSHCDNV